MGRKGEGKGGPLDADSLRWKTREGSLLSASTTRNQPIPIPRLSDPHPHLVTLRELIRMTRPSCIPGELGLAFMGSLLAAGSFACFSMPQVWLVALFSAATGAFSMVINDYFDFRSGADALKPKPLTLGTVHPEQALLAAAVFYLVTMFCASIFLHSLPLRALVSSSLVATFLYTPLLKGVCFVKNLIVAFVISQAIVAGGLAVGGANMYRALVPAMYVFCTIMWQEITMDINDEEGDRKAGIRTLPVAIGKNATMSIACVFAFLAACAPLLPLAISAAPFNPVSATLIPLIQSIILVGSVKAWKGRLDRDKMDKVLDWCFPAIGASLAVLVAFPG